MVERADRILPPDGIAIGGPQDERERVGAVPARDVCADSEPDGGGELGDRHVAHRAGDHDLTRLVILRDRTARHECLGLRGGEVVGCHRAALRFARIHWFALT